MFKGVFRASIWRRALLGGLFVLLAGWMFLRWQQGACPDGAGGRPGACGEPPDPGLQEGSIPGNRDGTPGRSVQ